MNSVRFVRAAFGLFVVLLVAFPVSAATILYETRFDFEPFVPGPFTNQDGWTGFGIPGATIQDDTFLSFNQAVRYDSATSSAGQSARLRPVFYTPGPADDQVVIFEVDALLSGTGTLSAYGYQFYGSSGPSRGGFNVLEDGSIQLATAGFPLLAPGIIERGEWQRWAVAANMETQRFDVYIDGILRAGNLPFLANISTFGAAGPGIFNGATTSEVAYFDNFSIRTAVPEPATAGLLLLGGAYAVSRRRGSRS